jgi:hypothetical protein
MSRVVSENCLIEWFAERNIDVWLAEELRINDAFARWMLKKAGVPDGLETPAIQTRIAVL